MGRKRDDILNDGKAINKCEEARWQVVDTGYPPGGCWDLWPYSEGP